MQKVVSHMDEKVVTTDLGLSRCPEESVKSPNPWVDRVATGPAAETSAAVDSWAVSTPGRLQV